MGLRRGVRFVFISVLFCFASLLILFLSTTIQYTADFTIGFSTLPCLSLHSLSCLHYFWVAFVVFLREVWLFFLWDIWVSESITSRLDSSADEASATTSTSFEWTKPWGLMGACFMLSCCTHGNGIWVKRVRGRKMLGDQPKYSACCVYILQVTRSSHCFHSSFNPFCLLVLLFSIPANYVYFMFKCFSSLIMSLSTEFFILFWFCLVDFCRGLFLLQIYVLLQLSLWIREELTY